MRNAKSTEQLLPLHELLDLRLYDPVQRALLRTFILVVTLFPHSTHCSRTRNAKHARHPPSLLVLPSERGQQRAPPPHLAQQLALRHWSSDHVGGGDA